MINTWFFVNKDIKISLSNEIKEFLEKNGVIKNNNIKIDNEKYSIQDILGEYSDKYISK